MHFPRPEFRACWHMLQKVGQRVAQRGGGRSNVSAILTYAGCTTYVGVSISWYGYGQRVYGKIQFINHFRALSINHRTGPSNSVLPCCFVPNSFLITRSYHHAIKISFPKHVPLVAGTGNLFNRTCLCRVISAVHSILSHLVSSPHLRVILQTSPSKTTKNDITKKKPPPSSKHLQARATKFIEHPHGTGNIGFLGLRPMET